MVQDIGVAVHGVLLHLAVTVDHHEDRRRDVVGYGIVADRSLVILCTVDLLMAVKGTIGYVLGLANLPRWDPRGSDCAVTWRLVNAFPELS